MSGGTQASEPGGGGKDPPMVRFFFGTRRVLFWFIAVLNTLFTGIWLGILNRKQLLAVGERHYGEQRMYRRDEYNLSGLMDWERWAVEKEFAGCRRLLLGAAGGGRETLALRKLGIAVDAFESDPRLVETANDFLKRQGMEPDVRGAPWDHCPGAIGEYDGAILGWGAYSHIRGRATRVALLREFRERLPVGAPMMLSFFTTAKDTRYFRVTATIGNALARVLGRERVEIGDGLMPNYSHYFTEKRVREEMHASGFELSLFRYGPYGHGIGRAVADTAGEGSYLDPHDAHQ